MNLLHFKEYDSVFEVIKEYVDKELRTLMAISYDKPDPKESIKGLLSKIPGFSSKIGIQSLVTLRLETQKSIHLALIFFLFF